MENFLDLTHRGKTEWWRYLVSLLLIVFFWFVLGSVPAVALVVYAGIDENPSTSVDLATGFVDGIDPMINFVVLNLSFIALLIGLFLAVRFIHQRPFHTLITPYKQINWQRIAQGFGVYLLLVFLASLVEYALNPEIYTLTLQPARFIPFTLLILIFTPLQTSAEELFFRGYLLQAAGHFGRNFIVLSLVNGVIFMIPHLANPEIESGPVLLALYFVGIGAFLAYITLRDNGLELALGAHAANNVYTAVFANYTNSVLPTESIFTVTELNPAFGLAALVVMATLFLIYFFVMRPAHRPAPPLESSSHD